MKDWLPYISLIMTLATLLYITGVRNATVEASVASNKAAISKLEKQNEKITVMSEDIAVIKEILKRYDAENQRRYNQ